MLIETPASPLALPLKGRELKTKKSLNEALLKRSERPKFELRSGAVLECSDEFSKQEIQNLVAQ